MQRVPDKDRMQVGPQQETMESSVRREILIEPVKVSIQIHIYWKIKFQASNLLLNVHQIIFRRRKQYHDFAFSRLLYINKS